VVGMECEICGCETKKIFIAKIEEAVLRVCEECSKGGEILNIIIKNNEPKIEKSPLYYEEDEYELIEGYGKIIEEARKKIGISLEDLARRIGEKESLIRKIEREEIRPSDKIIEKLEKFLKIKLREKFDYKPKENNKKSYKGLRIADVVKIKD
jgi:putative transcription factor